MLPISSLNFLVLGVSVCVVHATFPPEGGILDVLNGASAIGELEAFRGSAFRGIGGPPPTLGGDPRNFKVQTYSYNQPYGRSSGSGYRYDNKKGPIEYSYSNKMVNNQPPQHQYHSNGYKAEDLQQNYRYPVNQYHQTGRSQQFNGHPIHNGQQNQFYRHNSGRGRRGAADLRARNYGRPVNVGHQVYDTQPISRHPRTDRQQNYPNLRRPHQGAPVPYQGTVSKSSGPNLAMENKQDNTIGAFDIPTLDISGPRSALTPASGYGSIDPMTKFGAYPGGGSSSYSIPGGTGPSFGFGSAVGPGDFGGMYQNYGPPGGMNPMGSYSKHFGPMHFQTVGADLQQHDIVNPQGGFDPMPFDKYGPDGGYNEPPKDTQAPQMQSPPRPSGQGTYGREQSPTAYSKPNYRILGGTQYKIEIPGTTVLYVETTQAPDVLKGNDTGLNLKQYSPNAISRQGYPADYPTALVPSIQEHKFTAYQKREPVSYLTNNQQAGGEIHSNQIIKPSIADQRHIPNYYSVQPNNYKTSQPITYNEQQQPQPKGYRSTPQGSPGNQIGYHPQQPPLVQTRQTGQTPQTRYPAAQPIRYSQTQPVAYSQTQPTGHIQAQSSGYSQTQPVAYPQTKSTGHIQAQSSGYSQTQPVAYSQTQPTGHIQAQSSGYPKTQLVSYPKSQSTSYTQVQPTGYQTRQPVTYPSESSSGQYSIQPITTNAYRRETQGNYQQHLPVSQPIGHPQNQNKYPARQLGNQQVQQPLKAGPQVAHPQALPVQSPPMYLHQRPSSVSSGRDPNAYYTRQTAGKTANMQSTNRYPQGKIPPSYQGRVPSAEYQTPYKSLSPRAGQTRPNLRIASLMPAKERPPLPLPAGSARV